VGSGPGVLGNQMGFIDSHDVVVRVNNFKLSSRTGHRTDVFYSFFGFSIKKTPTELKRSGVTLCMCKCPNAKAIESPWHTKMGKHAGVDYRYIYISRRNFWFCDTYIPSTEDFLKTFEMLNRRMPTTGFSALIDILSFNPASVYMTGFDFFRSGIHNVTESWRPKSENKQDPISHNPEAERIWLEKNINNYNISMDDALSKLIKARQPEVA